MASDVTTMQVRTAQGADAHLFLPAGEQRAPAVVILHERYGLVQHTLDLARRLASDGYVSLAPDLFSHWSGDREALRRGDIQVTLPDQEVAAVVTESLEYLQAHERVLRDKIVLMGVCQSGRYPVVVTSERNDVAGCVILYGAAQGREWPVNDIQPRPLEEMLATMNAPSLLIYGEADHTISISDVLRVRGALEAGRRSYRLRIFGDMPHGWLNDTMPGRYRPKEAEEAWAMIQTFLDEVFNGRWPASGRVVWEFLSDSSQTYDFSKNVRYE